MNATSNTASNRKDLVQEAIKTIIENWTYDDDWKTDTELLSELHDDEEIKTKSWRCAIEDQFEELPSFTTEDIEEITLALRKAFPKQDKTAK